MEVRVRMEKVEFEGDALEIINLFEDIYLDFLL